MPPRVFTAILIGVIGAAGLTLWVAPRLTTPGTAIIALLIGALVWRIIALWLQRKQGKNDPAQR